MATYSKELKESLITKMLAQDISAAELAEAVHSSARLFKACEEL